jgi:hypothetical protein
VSFFWGSLFPFVLSFFFFFSLSLSLALVHLVRLCAAKGLWVSVYLGLPTGCVRLKLCPKRVCFSVLSLHGSCAGKRSVPPPCALPLQAFSHPHPSPYSIHLISLFFVCVLVFVCLWNKLSGSVSACAVTPTCTWPSPLPLYKLLPFVFIYTPCMRPCCSCGAVAPTAVFVFGVCVCLCRLE